MEFSKILAIIDTAVWVLLCIAALILLCIFPQSASYFSSILTTISTSFVAVRLAYSAKSGVENYKKISNQLQSLSNEVNYEENYEEEENG